MLSNSNIMLVDLLSCLLNFGITNKSLIIMNKLLCWFLNFNFYLLQDCLHIMSYPVCEVIGDQAIIRRWNHPVGVWQKIWSLWRLFLLLWLQRPTKLTWETGRAFVWFGGGRPTFSLRGVPEKDCSNSQVPSQGQDNPLYRYRVRGYL